MFITFYLDRELSAVFGNQIRNTHTKGVNSEPNRFLCLVEKTIEYFYFYFLLISFNRLDFHVGLFG